MHSSRTEKTRCRKADVGAELCDFNQLGLDFVSAPSYSEPLQKGKEHMNQDLIAVLENKIGDIVEKYSALKAENERLNEEIQRLSSDREGIKSRVDAILGKLDGI
jgi:cell division protein ZapB